VFSTQHRENNKSSYITERKRVPIIFMRFILAALYYDNKKKVIGGVILNNNKLHTQDHLSKFKFNSYLIVVRTKSVC